MQLVDDFIQYKTGTRLSKFTLDNYRIAANDFCDFCQLNNKEISVASAGEFLLHRSENLKENSLALIYRELQVFLQWHLKLEHKPKLPFRLKPDMLGAQPSFSYEQMANILNEARFRRQIDYVFIRTLLATFARRKEITYLRKENLVTTFDENGNTYFIIRISQDIAKTIPRDIFVDEVTFKLLKDFKFECEKPAYKKKMDNGEIDPERIFPFSLVNANAILAKYMPYGSKGNIHAIRRGVSNFVAFNNRRTDTDYFILEYLMGHLTRKSSMFARYSLADLPKNIMWEWYKNWNPIMVMHL